MRFNDSLYNQLGLYLENSQKRIQELRKRVDKVTNEGYTYDTVTKITNTWRLIDLTYQNIVRDPFPDTADKVYDAVTNNPTLYQTNLNFLKEIDYKYPVYTVVWRIKLEDSDNSITVYNPLLRSGITATQADADLGNKLPTTATRINASVMAKRPFSYQVFYTEYTWLGGLRRAFIMSYLPYPDKPYDWHTNPIYAIASGLL